MDNINMNDLTDKFWDSSKATKSLIKKVAKRRNIKATNKLVSQGWTIDELQIIIELFY